MEEPARQLLFGGDDALFPKQAVKRGARIEAGRLDRERYATAQIVGQVIKGAFRAASLQEFIAHSIRKTRTALADMLDQSCRINGFGERVR